MTNELRIIILPGEWELWFLNDERVFSDHRMEALDLLEMLPRFGPNFAWSYLWLDSILSGERRNAFIFRASEMPTTYADLLSLLTEDEILLLEDRLVENRTRP